MEVHQQLSLAIAVSDLKYVGGNLLSSGSHPRSWPFSHWGATVAFEAIKHLRTAHGISPDLRWEPKIAAAARNGGKFFEGNSGQFKSVIKDFRRLIEVTHSAYFPDDRVGREYDYLRNDLAVVTEGSEVLLTNVTGHFMVGMPPDRGIDMDTWGPHLKALAMGIGELTGALAPSSPEELHLHGSRPQARLSWWDGKVEDFVPNIFAGELNGELAMPLVSIYSSLQTTRRWARADCCTSCEVAALKHRFTVLYPALSSLVQLRSRANNLGPVAIEHLSVLVDSPWAKELADRPFRSLRNGWLHLGFDKVASSLFDDANLWSPINAYTGMTVGEFVTLVDQGIDEASFALGVWLSESGPHGVTIFDSLEPADLS